MDRFGFLFELTPEGVVLSHTINGVVSTDEQPVMPVAQDEQWVLLALVASIKGVGVEAFDRIVHEAKAEFEGVISA